MESYDEIVETYTIRADIYKLTIKLLLWEERKGI